MVNILHKCGQFTFLILLLSLRHSLAYDYFEEDVTPFKILENTQRLLGESPIDQTSPILGAELANRIKNDSRSPKEILENIKTDFPNFSSELLLSMNAYLDTFSGGLDTFCKKGGNESTAGDWTLPHFAAIPKEVITPLTNDYFAHMKNARRLRLQYLKHPERLKLLLKLKSDWFQKRRSECANKGIFGIVEEVLREYFPLLPNHKRLLRLNYLISSPEASYPRVQFSINGYTQYVYNELLKNEFLEEVLEATYGEMDLLLRLDKEGKYIQSETIKEKGFLRVLVENLIEQGFDGRDIILILSYSMRNMPSLDSQYGIDVNKALALEVYFWKMREFRDQMEKDIMSDIYPKKDRWGFLRDFGRFKKNPGVYHYMTAALMSCEVLRKGFSNSVALGLARLGKVAYKFSKLLGEMKGLQVFRIGHYLDKQGTMAGLQAGREGGAFGIEICR